MRIPHLLLSILFLFCTFLSADENAVLKLRGHLAKEDVTKAEESLDVLAAKQLIIEINSNSGELAPVLELAKRIYELKIEKGLKVIVYIEDNAVGPVAIIPFLADELYISLAVSWGDIPLGTQQALTTNILRNRVVSFIPPHHPQAALLSLMAAAMSDPSVQIVDEGGWKMTEGNQKTDSSRGVSGISSPGEPLVVNQNQLQQLKLVGAGMSLQQFEEHFKLTKAVKEALPPAPITPLAKSKEFLDRELASHIKFTPEGPNKVGLITIEDRTNGISESTWIYVKKALDTYKEQKPIFVILELNTPGGEVFAAQKISDALKELDTQYNIPVVAYINNWAISAGAMLAYSCRYIAVVKDASMGAAEPLTVEASGESKVASEKVNSALRSDFASRASFFGRNPDIAEGMVDKDILLVYRYGKIVRLDNENQIRTTGPDPDIIVKAKGKLLTLNSEQLIKYGVADLLLPPQKLDPVTEEEKEKGEWPASKMLLFKAPFFDSIPHTMLAPYRMDWKTRFFVFLTSPMISSLLFLGLIVGLYMELSSPGFGLAGTIAATCLFLIILSSFALEIANWLELILLLTGLAILFVELFVLPTFGLLGFIGLMFFLVGLFGMMLPGIGSVSYEVDTQTLNAAGEAFFQKLAWLCGTLVVAFGIILFLARYVTPTLAGFSRFVLTGHEQEGYIAGASPKSLPQPGAEGEVVATLRPAGKVMIDDAIYDAISPGAFIEKGTKVIVDRLDGSVIVVNVKSSQESL